jgi:hypothetical protein
MAARRSAAASTSASPGATATEAFPAEDSQAVFPDWMAQAAQQGIQPEQALAFIGLGLMRKLASAGQQDLPWIWNEAEDGGQADLAGLRQRLELTQLALETGAPLSTAEVSLLLGARPGAATIERGGLVARRVSRNVWKLNRAAEAPERATSGFNEGFRRRL